MTKEKVLQPALRFKGFEGDWETRKLKEIFNYISNNSLSRADLNDKSGLAMNIHYGDILIRFGDVLDIQKSKVPFVTDDEFARKNRLNCLQEGDVVIADAAEDSTVGKCTEIYNLRDNVLLSGLHTIAIRPIIPFASKYLGYYLNSNSYHNQLLGLMQGTKVLSISKSSIKDTEIYYPSELPEQAKIGDLSKDIDQQLKLHQAKHTKLQQLKKAMLSKMFPKEGEKVPEIRFAGFSGDWDLKTLGEVAFKVVEKNHLKKEIETFTNSAELGIILQRKYFDKSISNIENIGSYFIVEPESFVYNPRISALAPVGPINRNKLKETGIVSPLYTVFKVNTINSSFLEYYFKSECWHTFMFLNGDTGARADRFSIKDSVFFQLPITFPVEQEQTKIGNYFKNLDRLIALQQQQIYKLQNIKKALLEKMFV